MIFNEKELSFINLNKPIIKGILEKKLEDTLNELIYEKDPVKTEVLKLWAKETKELIIVLENRKEVKKDKNPYTGI